MATAGNIVTRALVLAGQIEAGETPVAEEMNDGIDALNEMLFAWVNEGVDLGHSTVAQADDLIVHDTSLEGVRYNLAVRLAGEYGFTLPARVMDRADKTFRALQGVTLEVDDDLHTDRALHPRYFNRRIGAYNVEEG